MNEVIIKSLLTGDALKQFETNKDISLQQLKENVEWKVLYAAGLKPANYTFLSHSLEVCPVAESAKILSLKYALDYVPDYLKSVENIEIK